jgi:hypothetical protein
MGSFASKYPAFAALLALVGQGVQKMAATGETLIQKVEGEVVLIPGILGFISSGQGSLIGPEIAQLKASAPDAEAALEYAVDELDFTSEKATTVIPLAFAVGEWAAAGVAPIKALVAAL